jgi:undecaprenyldiphospho-muramoylpentapeptide beta-N-acetylglucosaminyltransferase
MSSRIMLSGGGTGGHIFPMQAVADALLEAGVDAADLCYVGSTRGMESTLLGDGQIELVTLPGRGIRRSFRPRALLQNIGAVVGLSVAMLRGLFLVARRRPACVVSFGGFASAPASLAAVVLRRPLVLIEFDAAPGLAQRIVRQSARVRCTAFTSNDARVVVTGAPVRASIESVQRSATTRIAALGQCHPVINPAKFVIVVMTGSLGSTTVNDAVSTLAREWQHRDDLCIVHVTGRRDYANVLAAAPRDGVLDYRVVEFGDMASLWAIADLAICRAGAMTVAELTLLGIPSILVPLPNAPGDHQRHNAQHLETAGAATVILDAACTSATLASAIEAIRENGHLAEMATSSQKLGTPHAATNIAKVILEVAGQ